MEPKLHVLSKPRTLPSLRSIQKPFSLSIWRSVYRITLGTLPAVATTWRTKLSVYAMFMTDCTSSARLWQVRAPVTCLAERACDAFLFSTTRTLHGASAMSLSRTLLYTCEAPSCCSLSAISSIVAAGVRIYGGALGFWNSHDNHLEHVPRSTPQRTCCKYAFAYYMLLCVTGWMVKRYSSKLYGSKFAWYSVKIRVIQKTKTYKLCFSYFWICLPNNSKRSIDFRAILFQRLSVCWHSIDS